MSAKEALIFDVNNGMSIEVAAQRHSIARSCAYKWVGRYRELGLAGLEEQSRRPENSPTRTDQELVDELLAIKKKYPDFGPAKLVELLEERRSGKHVMAVSTAGRILAGHGRVKKRRTRGPSAGRIDHTPYTVAGAGDSMTADYKGQFRMGNGELCYPLTIADPFSRYLLWVEAMSSTHMAPAKAAFERVFREYGVPRQIITDNGTPFCSATSLGGLTQLSRWWIEIGSTPVRIAPGRPDQNGIHERMHRTFKQWIERHRKPNLAAQQRSFVAFRKEFNDIRPHQALGQKKPASAFRPYKPFPSKLPVIEYDSTMDVRKVNANGEIKWSGHQIFVSEVLIGAHVGLLPVAEQLWSIHFAHVRIGFLDGRQPRAINRRPPEGEQE
jgi:transposase InsO family protein